MPRWVDLIPSVDAHLNGLSRRVVLVHLTQAAATMVPEMKTGWSMTFMRPPPGVECDGRIGDVLLIIAWGAWDIGCISPIEVLRLFQDGYVSL